MSPAYDKRQLLKSAYNYAQGGSWDKALDEYRRITKLFPEDPNVHSMVADILIKKGDPAGAAAEHLEAAKLHKAQNADDKELSSLRKALKVQSGHSEARERLDSYFTRQVARLSQLMADNKFKPAEELAQKLLDADPGHLQVNRLMDEIRAKQMQDEAVAGLLEEERMAAAAAPVVDTTREVMQRLKDTADAYLKAEDFDNAIETLMIMLKIEPGRVEIRGQMEEAQEKLRKKQQAHVVWQAILAKDSTQIEEVKEREVSAKELAEWASQEQAVRERLAMELEGAEEAARQEIEVIERAVKEIRERNAAKPASPGAESAPPSAVQASINAADETRLRALEIEKRQLEERLTREREEAVERERQIQEQVRRESELLRHAIEMEKLEVEAKAKEAALKDLESKLQAEREAQARLVEEERRRSRDAEEALRSQLQERMKAEMAKMRDELQAQNMEDLQQRMDEQRRMQLSVEEEGRRRHEEAEAGFRKRQAEAEQARREAEAQARTERDAMKLEKLSLQSKAKAEALLEFEARLKSEREAQAAQLEEERRRARSAEEGLHKQLQELMRQEMAKMRDEMQVKTMAELQQRLDEERRNRDRMEEELKRREQEAVERYRQEQRLMEESKRQAEDKARVEREAIEGLKAKEENRKQAIVDEALKRRGVRTGAAASSEDKQKVLQASRRISDALHAAATKHLEQDVDGMYETAKRYLQQDLLLDAMRLCQKIAVIDPQNENVKALLKEIYVRKGL